MFPFETPFEFTRIASVHVPAAVHESIVNLTSLNIMNVDFIEIYLTSGFDLNGRWSNYLIHLTVLSAYVRVRYDLGTLDPDIFTVIHFSL